MELEHAVENWASSLMLRSFEVCHISQTQGISQLICSYRIRSLNKESSNWLSTSLQGLWTIIQDLRSRFWNTF